MRKLLATVAVVTALAALAVAGATPGELPWSAAGGEAMRDLVLLVGAGLLVGGTLLTTAREVYRVDPGPRESGPCLERWDERQEWLPHVDCADLAQMVARKKGK